MKKVLLLFTIVVLFVIILTGCNKKNPTENKFEVVPVTDIDGNVYQTVQIGNQVWMAENLKVTHYRNGDSIPNATWSNLTTGGGYCNYDNNTNNAAVYGRLYNWYAVNDSRNIAPAGWHVPSDDEWKELEMSLGMSSSETDDVTSDDDGTSRGTDEGSKLAGNASLWVSGTLKNNTAFGETGFSALPGGYCDYDGFFSSMCSRANFWSATESSNGNP